MNKSAMLIIAVMLSLPGRALIAEQLVPPVPEYRLEYRLNVSFDVPNSKIIGRAEVPVQAGREMSFATGDLKILQMSVNDKPVDFLFKAGIVSIKPLEDGALVIMYEGIFKGNDPVGDRNYGVVSSAIDERGMSLTGTWYPQMNALASYHLTAVLPRGFEAVSEAENISKIVKDGNTEFSFEFTHPVDGISLIATDRYEVTRESVNGLELYGYFFKEDRELAKTYIQSARKYFELYEKLLVKYPYTRFSIVENFLPTGYSMPTFTLLGQDVVRLPFITETSLGHEILHQWFGNSVYIDSAKGNWAEGLTTYLADHLYEEEKGKGWEYRKRMLADYAAYVNARNEFPLREFRGRTDFASRSIGYGKAAMVFHMLKKTVGEEKFFGALQEFIKQRQYLAASWDDLRSVFEKSSGKDLGGFFKQWLNEKGLSDIRIEDASVLRKGSGFEVRIEMGRKGPVSALDVPLTIFFARGGVKKEMLNITREKETFTFLVDEEPSKLALDEEYDVARKLGEDETAPTIARLIGDEKPLIVSPRADRERYKAIIDELKKKGGEEKEARSVKDSELKSSSLVILGQDNPVINRLYGAMELPLAGFSLTLKKNPWNPDKVVGIFHARSAGETQAAFRKIFHYGKYSSLAFENGRNTAKKIDESERGMQMVLREEPRAVDLSLLRTLSGVIEAAAGKKIVYVGEYHDRHSHHNVQLQVIKTLYQKDPKLAIGMEMFQRPFQAVLDDYISGAIDEREFLRKSEYFKRWGFDYNLYKPILDFARAGKVRVVALNLKREITDKVSKEGMDALTDEERAELPRETDFSDEEYRERLKQVFQQHRNSQEKNFDFFLQAQVLWDETMSRSIDEFFKKNPDHRMVVIAGGGHVIFGAGIPKRTFRRNGLEYAIIMNDAEVEPGIADYIVFPQPLEGVSAPKLMASFTETDGKVGVADFGKDSVAKKAGLKIGDVVALVEGAPVNTVEDIKIALFYKKKNDILKVKVVRKRFLLGDKEMEFEVKL